MYTKNHSLIPLANSSRDKDKYQFLFENLSKKEWIEEQLSNTDSAFFEIIREEVEEFYYKVIKHSSSILSFDDLYSLAKHITVNQIQKSLKRKKRCFFVDKNNDKNTSMYYIKIKSRLINNIRNLYQPRKINVLDVPYMIISDVYTNYEIDFVVIDIGKISKREPLKLIYAINLLLINYEVNVDEVVDICHTYNIDLSNFPILDFSYQLRNLKKASNNQIVIDFMEVA